MPDVLSQLEAKQSARAEMSGSLITALDWLALAIQYGKMPRAEIAQAVERLTQAAQAHWMQDGDSNANARKFRDALESLRELRSHTPNATNTTGR